MGFCLFYAKSEARLLWFIFYIDPFSIIVCRVAWSLGSKPSSHLSLVVVKLHIWMWNPRSVVPLGSQTAIQRANNKPGFTHWVSSCYFTHKNTLKLLVEICPINKRHTKSFTAASYNPTGIKHQSGNTVARTSGASLNETTDPSRLLANQTDANQEVHCRINSKD